MEEMWRDLKKYLENEHPCIVCNSNDFFEWAKLNYLIAKKCNKCGMISVNPHFSDEGLKFLYSTYFKKREDSELLKENRKGFYHCANCGAKLFASHSKFDSGTGWPSFSEALPGAFKTKIDYSFGMKRIEYHCAKCGAHHGHVFDDGPTKTKKRFCNNGLCLIFKPE